MYLQNKKSKEFYSLQFECSIVNSLNIGSNLIIFPLTCGIGIPMMGRLAFVSLCSM